MKIKSVKKYFSLIVLSILTITLFGCGSNNKTVSTSGQAEKPKEIVASDQIINAKQYDKLIQIGDKVITLPAKFIDFTNAGATLESKELSLDYIMDANSTKMTDMSIGDTKFQLELENDTDKSDALKNATVKYIDNVQGKDIFFNGGINIGSKLDDLTQKWGEPSIDKSKGNDSDMTYCYYDYYIKPERLKTIAANISQEPISGSGNEYTVTIDRKTATVKNIQYKWSGVDNTSIIKTNSTDISFGSDKIKLSYEIPAFLQNDKNNIGICLIDNTPYIIIGDTNFQGLGDKKNNITDQNIADVINVKYSNIKYDIETLSKTENEVYAAGYFKSDNSLKCETLYMNKEHYYETYKWEIAPYDENGTLTDSAISKFKDLVTDFTKSVHETKA